MNDNWNSQANTWWTALELLADPPTISSGEKTLVKEQPSVADRIRLKVAPPSREEAIRARAEAKAIKVQERRDRSREYRAKNALRIRIARHEVTPEQFYVMVEAQDGRCPVCLRPAPRDEVGWEAFFVIDHDHNCCESSTSCGRCVRGLLCNGCNAGIGILGDDPLALERAVAYLLAYRGSCEPVAEAPAS